MADFLKVARNITKGKLPYENWNKFYADYMTGALRLSRVQFSLNFISMLYTEEFFQEDGIVSTVTDFIKIVEKALKSDYDRETNSASICDFRAHIKNRMDCLVTYTDRYMNYQYVLNCLRYKFEDYDYDDYDDEEFTKELMNFITNDRDQSTIRYKTMEVLKSLPIRMTRNRFFELISDGYSVYAEADMDTLNSFNYMIRGAAMLYEPANMQENFPDLYEYCEHFNTLNFEEFDVEKFYVEDITLKECIDFLNNQVSAYDILAQLINHLYAMVLACDYADKDSQEYKTVNNLISLAISRFNEGEVSEMDEEITALLVELEGVQEEELEELDKAEGAFGDILQCTFADECSDETADQIDEVDCVIKLLSTSYFADLEGDNEPVKVTQQDIDTLTAQFRNDLEPKLKGMSKLLGRALMASVMGYIPMNFADTEELSEYILKSLNACTNLPEKMALVERLEEVMNEDDWE